MNDTRDWSCTKHGYQVGWYGLVWNLAKWFLSWALQFAIGVALILSVVILHGLIK